MNSSCVAVPYFLTLIVLAACYWSYSLVLIARYASPSLQSFLHSGVLCIESDCGPHTLCPVVASVELEGVVTHGLMVQEVRMAAEAEDRVRRQLVAVVR